jgi:exosortase
MTLTTTPPTVRWLPWLPLILGALGVLYGMIGFWIRGYDNYDRAGILFASAYLVHLRQSRLTSLPDTPWPLLGMVLVAIGALAFLPPWFVFAQVGPRPVVLWWEALALLIATAGMIVIRSGPRLLLECRFMLIFPLFALPLPGRILNPLNEIMQGISADIGSAILPWIGVPVANKIGNHIMLRNGQGVEVAEMCSGMVMIRTTLALAALLAHLYGFRAVRSLILMSTTLPIIIFVNALRVAAFGWLQDHGHTEWVQPGWQHETVGYIAYIPGLIVVFFVVSWLKPKTPAEPITESLPCAEPTGGPTAFATAVLSAALLVAMGLWLAPGMGKSVGGDLSFEGFPRQLGKWRSIGNTDESEAVRENRQKKLEGIRRTLTNNADFNAQYYNTGGDRIDLWLFYWQSAIVVKDYHHPDICNQMQGFQTDFADLIEVRTAAGRVIPVTYREAQRDGNTMLIGYWTQEGRRLWTAANEARAKSFLMPILWTMERLNTSRSEDDSDDRLQVYMSLNVMKGRNREMQKAAILEMCALVADELYSRFPWADPGVAPIAK